MGSTREQRTAVRAAQREAFRNAKGQGCDDALAKVYGDRAGLLTLDQLQGQKVTWADVRR